MFLAILPALAFAVNPSVRSAHEGPQVAIAVQSDGRVLKVEDTKPAPAEQPQKSQKQISDEKFKADNEYLRNALKKTWGLDKDEKKDEKKEAKAEKTEPKSKIEAIEAKPHGVTAPAETAPAATAPAMGEIRAHEEVKAPAVKVTAPGEIKAHEAKKESKLLEMELPEGVALIEMGAPESSEESWKSAFFFFASLVLFAVLAIGMIAYLYKNREEAQKTGGAESAALKANAYVGDSSSTSDSGEKIAMLFDRVRQSLEDLSDKAPAGQADVAGGKTSGSNQI